MDRIVATEIKKKALEAITKLSELSKICQQKLSSDGREPLCRSAGLAIGAIQTDILDKLYQHYPELDDLH